MDTIKRSHEFYLPGDKIDSDDAKLHPLVLAIPKAGTQSTYDEIMAEIKSIKADNKSIKAGLVKLHKDFDKDKALLVVC